MKMKAFAIVGLIFACCFSEASAQELFKAPEGVKTRWASPENWEAAKGQGARAFGGRKGSANFPLAQGEEKILAEIKGTSGIIRRIWVTISDRSPEMLRGLRLEMYWDESSTPAVSVPLGDFFGMGLGQMVAFESTFFSSPEGRSFNCYIPMPFKNAALVKVVNESEKDLPMFFYDIDFTVGDQLSEEDLYFHAYFNRQNPTTLKKDYEFLPSVKGKGRFLGVNMGIKANTEDYLDTWWGEGEVKIFLDGDEEYPTLAGTGTEDYIGTGWELGAYAHLYQGCPIADHENMEFAFYRYHKPDPVYFYEDIRASIQQIGFAKNEKLERLGTVEGEIQEAGHGQGKVDFSKPRTFLLFERQDDYSSCAYFYLDKPENGLPALIPFNERIQ